jgi:hypothetical protein
MIGTAHQMGGACVTYGREEKRIQGFGNPEVKKPLGRSRLRWKYYINTHSLK